MRTSYFAPAASNSLPGETKRIHWAAQEHSLPYLHNIKHPTTMVSRSLQGSGILSHSSSGAASDIVGAEMSEAGQPDLAFTSPLASLSVQDMHWCSHKQFHCALCSYTATTNYQLTRHMRRHTGEKPFKCFLCSSAFAQGSDYRRHMSVHTGVKHFKCDLCSYSSVQKCDLEVHKRIHTGEKPYQCNECSYASARSADMRRHVLRHHK